ncbi:MAG: DUF1592 domain-containing protein [Planctomycetaceae bacterium]|nr:DUF1592 domain-containing protein [Planctomycetaceae bacterium]
MTVLKFFLAGVILLVATTCGFGQPFTGADPAADEFLDDALAADDESEGDESGDDESDDDERENDEFDDELEEDEPPTAEILEELDRELEETQRTRDRHAALLKLADRRLDVLRQLRRVQQSLATLGERFAQAEERGDERVLEELELEFGAAEFRVERLELQRELLGRRSDLVELTSEIPAAERVLKGDAEKLTGLIDSFEQKSSALFRAMEQEQGEELEDLEISLEQLEADFELQRETLGLKVELMHAREEGDPAWIEELESELRELGDISEALTRPEGLSKVSDFPAPVSLTPDQISAASRHGFADQIAPLLKKSCGDCHSSEGASGDLNFDQLMQQQPLVVNRDRWKNVIQQLTIRSMPPADAEPIPEEDRVLLTAWLTQAIDGFDYESIRQPGFEVTRRLTHEEYNNTVRDLLGADVRPADRFPADMTASSGFENSANSLFMQPVLLERYLGAAELVVDAALPADTKRRSAGWKLLLQDDDPLDLAQRKNIVRRFLTRAFRRPVQEDELDDYLQHVADRQTAGDSIERALREMIQVALVSPAFLMKTESDHGTKGAAAVSDWELASRLSYFLWSSMPDDRLFELAAAGQLHEPSVLTAQVRRLLEDPRSDTLGSQFAAQWLGFDGMDRLPRSPIDNPWQTDTLIAAMKRESATLFHHLVVGNEPVDRLVDADYTFVNQELARHYGLPGVRGDQFRKVSLQNTPRRGVLGHGSILAVTSFPGRTSPVMRGNWILSQLLGTPPPPPPNVSELDERVAENRRLSARQKLELHRSNPNCYTCHSQIDPLGFALESFEWYGRHRPRRSADTTASFPGGQPFQGLQGLAETLVTERIDDLAEQVTRRMLAYALGRQLEYYDEATVGDLVTAFQADDRKLQTLILAIVQSDAFQKRQHPSSNLSQQGFQHVR